MIQGRESYCGCSLGGDSWGRQGWHLSILTPFLADRFAREKHPFDETARADFRDLLEEHIGKIEVAYERCPAYMSARKRGAA